METIPLFPPKRILFPSDFSINSAAIAPMAAEFAERFDAELIVMHVAPLFPERSPEPLRSRLDAFAANELARLRTERVLLENDNDPAREIARYAQQQKIDLIMMATHGYGPFRRFLFGSVTLKVLHDAECAVWTSAHAERQPDFRRIVFRSVACAIDLTEKSCCTLKWAAEFASEYGAQLTIVHAIPFAMCTEVQYLHPDWQEQLTELSRADVAKLQKSVGVDAAVEIVTGDVAQAVRDVAERVDADLLVIGRSVPSGLIGRWGAHAFPIIRNSPCPVVSV
jgi:nucleotide-binding universal stress UspA family protein